jgi:hypothetical protein
MRTETIWLYAAVFGAAIGLGTLVFGLLILVGLIPVALIVIASRAKIAGAGGLGVGFGGIWTLTTIAAGEGCGPVNSGASTTGCWPPESFLFVSVGALVLGVALTAAVAVGARRHPQIES